MSNFALPNKKAITNFIDEQYENKLPLGIAELLSDAVIIDVYADWGDFTDREVENSFKYVDEMFKDAILYFLKDNGYDKKIFADDSIDWTDPFDMTDLSWNKTTFELIEAIREDKDVLEAFKAHFLTCSDFQQLLIDARNRED